MPGRGSRRRLMGHGLMAVLFALAAVWAVRTGWQLLAAGAAGERLALLALGLLGFLLLALREVRALRAAWRGEGVRSSHPAPPV